MKRCVAILMLFFCTALSANQETRTWEGSWRNATDGRGEEMRCVTRVVEKGKWSARFEGCALGRYFSYDIEISARQEGDKIKFNETVTIDSELYTWSGTISGDVFDARYRGSRGNRGYFTLHEVSPRPPNE